MSWRPATDAWFSSQSHSSAEIWLPKWEKTRVRCTEKLPRINKKDKLEAFLKQIVSPLFLNVKYFDGKSWFKRN